METLKPDVSVRLLSVGAYLPARVMHNKEFEATLETSDAWIRERTGIERRHLAAEGEMTSDMATHAAREALARANFCADDIDLIIVATTTPDETMPSCAARVQAKLGAHKAAAFDINAACSGFVYGMHLANSLLRTGAHTRALVIGAETLSRILDWKDRNTCILFGDGAGACVLETTTANPGEKPRGILASAIHSDGKLGDILGTTGGVSRTQTAGVLTMQGKEVFKHAVAKMAASVVDVVEKGGLNLADIDYVIPHQANWRIMASIAEKLALPTEKLISTVHLHANTSAASIPLALYVSEKQEKIKEGSVLVLTALGAGLTWGSCIIVR